MLDAARELFTEHGYRGATTREIAQRADVTEILIFGHFQTKAKLFEAAVLAPVEAAIEDLVGRRAHANHDASRWAQDCATELYDVLRDNRRMLMTLIAAQAHDAELAHRLRQLLARLSVMALDSAPAGRVFDAQACVTVELAIGAMLTATVHGELLFGPDVHPTREAVLDHLTQQLHAAGETRGQH